MPVAHLSIGACGACAVSSEKIGYTDRGAPVRPHESVCGDETGNKFPQTRLLRSYEKRRNGAGLRAERV